MVDEYQDTNDLQNRLLMKLCSTHHNICVVGDDDQSIYGWRGANVKNILEFHEHFPNTRIIKLEKNYRSTKKILEAANNLIEHNRNRLGKRLEAVLGEGEDIEVMSSNDEQEEATRIGQKILSLIEKGEDPKEIAVLFRINALSRSLEEAFNRLGLNFQLVGTIRFYERQEVKDIISYFRIIANPKDEFSLKRIINRPKRGVGKATYEKLQKAAHETGTSILELMMQKSQEELEAIVGKKNAKALKEFAYAIELLAQKSNESLYNFIEEFERLIGLRKYYESLPDGFERVLNIDEFYGLFRDYIKQNPENSLEDFWPKSAFKAIKINLAATPSPS
jgi:DNA helicase-2/ATP-dependent DNA helicase PcrA